MFQKGALVEPMVKISMMNEQSSKGRGGWIELEFSRAR
jgi:hypothetical protein